MPEPCQTAMAIFLLRAIFVVMFFSFSELPVWRFFFFFFLRSPLRVLFPFPDILHKGVRVFAGLDQFLSGVLVIF